MRRGPYKRKTLLPNPNFKQCYINDVHMRDKIAFKSNMETKNAKIPNQIICLTIVIAQWIELHIAWRFGDFKTVTCNCVCFWHGYQNENKVYNVAHLVASSMAFQCNTTRNARISLLQAICLCCWKQHQVSKRKHNTYILCLQSKLFLSCIFFQAIK